MTGQSFSLVPFPAQNIPEITLKGMISRLDNRIQVQYSLAGKIEDVVLAAPSERPRRCDGLWKSTCFEMFLAIKDQPRYWEFNFSPSGDWNVYRMDRYRRIGFSEEISIQKLPFRLTRQPNMFALTAIIDLDNLVQQSDTLDVGLSSIVQTKSGAETYLALTHPADQPDFHCRESFILGLAGQTQP